MIDYTRHNTKVKILLAVLITAAVVVAGILVINILNDENIGIGSARAEREKANTVYIDEEPYLKRQDIKTYLLIGIDDTGEFVSSGSYNNEQQADFLLLISVNKTDKTYSFIQFNRDTMCDIDILGITGKKVGTAYAQLCLSHSYGDGLSTSCKNTANAVSNLLYGVNVDYYVAVTMDAVGIIADFYDGIDVTLDADYTEIDPSYVKDADVKFTSENVLGFVRARGEMNEPTNIARMGRHKLFLNAFVNEAKNKDYTLSELHKLYNDIEKYMVTNCSTSSFDGLFDSFDTYTQKDWYIPEGTSKVGPEFMEFYVDEGKLKEYVKTNFLTKK